MERKGKEENNKLIKQNQKNIIRIKFADKLLKISNNVKHENYIYEDIYKNYIDNWKSICILNAKHSLYTLLDYIARDDVYNIRKTIIGLITDDNLEDTLYVQFVEEFINL